MVLLYLGMVKDSHDNLELTQLTDRMTVRRYRRRRPADVVVGGYAWLSMEHLKLAPGLSRKLAAKFFGPFRSLMLLALCLSALSCLVSGVFTMFFMHRSSSPPSVMMVLKPLPTYHLSVLLLMSWASMKSRVFLITANVSVVGPCM